MKSTLKFRNAKLVLDNLSDEECLLLGTQHNKDNAFHASASFVDKCVLYRNSWFDHYKVLVEDDDSDVKITDWQKACLRIDDEEVNSNELRHHSPTFSVCRWDDDSFDLLLKIDDMHQNYKLKGMKQPKRSKSSSEFKVNSVGSTYITALCGLTVDRRINLLTAIVNGSISLKDARTEAMSEKKNQRVIQAMQKLGGYNSEAEVRAVVPRHYMQKAFQMYARMFSTDGSVKKIPRAFEQFFQQVKQNIRQVQERAARRGAGGEEGEGDEVSKFEFHRILLHPQEFKGYLEVGGGAAAGVAAASDDLSRDDILYASFKKLQDIQGVDPEISETTVYSVQGDLKENQVWDTLKKISPKPWSNGSKFELVMMDPPYGKTQEVWDTKFEKEDFEQLVGRVCGLNEGRYFTLVAFCAVEQISHYLDVLEALKQDPAFRWRVFYKHGVWSKGKNHYVGASQETLVEADELIVFAWFLKKDPAAVPVLISNCFDYDQDEKKINLFEYSTVKSKRMVQNDEGRTTPANICQKPIRLLADIICHFTSPDDCVLDLFSGTGSTAVACVLYNRNCVLVDIGDFQTAEHRKRLTELSQKVNEYAEKEDPSEKYFSLDVTKDGADVPQAREF